MKPVGRIAITGTEGFDLSYIALIPSPTGRKTRSATHRPIRFAEAYNGGPSTAYDLTAGEFDLNDSDKNKSAGVLYPAAQLIMRANVRNASGRVSCARASTRSPNGSWKY
jgi:hypothetical protein